MTNDRSTNDARSTPSTVSAKVPGDVAETFAALAAERKLTTSALLRRLIDGALAGELGDDAGPVETATRDELHAAGVFDSRAATAINLAQRLDRDPTSAAPITTVLRSLLNELAIVKQSTRSFSRVEFLRLSLALRRAGWLILNGDGQRFDTNNDWPADGFASVFDLQP